MEVAPKSVEESFLAFMSRKRLADKLGQIRLDWAVSQNEVQTTDKAKISALGCCQQDDREIKSLKCVLKV